MNPKTSPFPPWIFGLVLLMISPISAAQPSRYTVQPGDTLWDIAERYLYSTALVQPLRRYNGIAVPKKLQPGVDIKFRPVWLKGKPIPARIIQQVGRAEIVRNDSQVEVAEVGLALAVGDALRTFEQTTVVVEFGDGSLLTIRDYSILAFDRISFHKRTGIVDTRLRLERGQVESQVKPSKHNASRFEIHTRAATLGVRGTDFRVGLDSNDAFRSEVFAGAIDVGAERVKRKVPAFFGTLAEQGKVPLPARPLPVKPRVIPMIDRWLTGQSPILIRWHPVKWAVAYRVLVSRNSNFTHLIKNEVVESKNQYSLEFDDGPLYVAVRAIDRHGLEGLQRQLGFGIQSANSQADVHLQTR